MAREPRVTCDACGKDVTLDGYISVDGDVICAYDPVMVLTSYGKKKPNLRTMVRIPEGEYCNVTCVEYTTLEKMKEQFDILKGAGH